MTIGSVTEKVRHLYCSLDCKCVLHPEGFPPDRSSTAVPYHSMLRALSSAVGRRRIEMVNTKRNILEQVGGRQK